MIPASLAATITKVGYCADPMVGLKRADTNPKHFRKNLPQAGLAKRMQMIAEHGSFHRMELNRALLHRKLRSDDYQLPQDSPLREEGLTIDPVKALKLISGELTARTHKDIRRNAEKFLEELEKKREELGLNDPT